MATPNESVPPKKSNPQAVQAGKPGQTITITYYVGNNKRTTSATLGNQAQAQPAPSSNSGGTP